MRVNRMAAGRIAAGKIVVIMLATLALQPLPSSAEGEMVEYIEAKQVDNPPPSVSLDAFDRFEIAPIAMGTPYESQEVNQQAKQRLQVNLDERVPPTLAEWNAREAKQTPPRTLKIEPTIRHVKFISGKARFWAGAFAGGSAVLMTVKLSDAATGEVIAEPEFYQHANAFGAAASYGATDKAMLVRVADMVANYLKSNYIAAVGGPTGKSADKDKKAKSKDGASEGTKDGNKDGESADQPTQQ